MGNQKKGIEELESSGEIGKESAKMREPKQLVRGKKFHKKLQEDWHKTAEGEVESEKYVKKPSGQIGLKVKMRFTQKSLHSLFGF